MINYLSTLSEFNTAFLRGDHVEVWLDGHLEDYGGPIERHTLLDVRINGVWYRKTMYEFRIKPRAR